MNKDFSLRFKEIDINEPQSEEMAACIKTWHNWRGELAMPVWAGSSLLLDFPPQVLSLTAVTDVILDPLDFVYRYWGSEFTDVYGQDVTGKSCTMIKPKEFASTVFHSHKEVFTRKQPLLYVEETVSKGHLVISELMLRLPMSSDGETVDKIISIARTDVPSARNWFKSLP